MTAVAGAFLEGVTGFAVLATALFETAVGLETGFEALAEVDAFLTGFAAGMILRGGVFFKFFSTFFFGRDLGVGLAAVFLTVLTEVALAGAFLTPVEGFTDFPEDFRDGVGLEIFFNGTQFWPKSRA